MLLAHKWKERPVCFRGDPDFLRRQPSSYFPIFLLFFSPSVILLNSPSMVFIGGKDVHVGAVRSVGVTLAVSGLSRLLERAAAFATGAGFSNQYQSIGEEGGPDY